MERPETLGEVLDLLLHFGAAMLRSGNTAIRTREWMEVMARKMGCDATAVSLSVDTVEVNVTRAGERAMSMCEVGPPGINAWRIGELEQLVRAAEPEISPGGLIARLIEIDPTSLFGRPDCNCNRGRERGLCFSQRQRRSRDDCSIWYLRSGRGAD